MTERLYPYSDAMMLVAGKVVAHSLRLNVNELSEIRAGWNRVYATDLDSRLDILLSNVLHFPAAKANAFAHFNMFLMMQKAASDLYNLKIQLDVDYMHSPEKLNEYYQLFGISNSQGDFTFLSEEGLLRILERVEKNLEGCILYEFKKNGISDTLINRIKAYAAKFRLIVPIKDMVQNHTKDLVDLEIDLLNAIYDELIGICIIARGFYRKSLKKQQLFMFPEIVLHLEGQQPHDYNFI